jgi:hypothetical protein
MYTPINFPNALLVIPNVLVVLMPIYYIYVGNKGNGYILSTRHVNMGPHHLVY